MTIDITDSSGCEWDFSLEELMHLVAGEVMREEQCPCDVQFSLSVVNDDMIRQLNRDFRNIDSVTDVLSFPMINFGAPSDFESLGEDIITASSDPDTDELCLGDIVIAGGRAKQQASEYGHTDKREMAFLAAHSLLHLMGYDHMTDSEAEIMEKKQEKILRSIGITREA